MTNIKKENNDSIKKDICLENNEIIMNEENNLTEDLLKDLENDIEDMDEEKLQEAFSQFGTMLQDIFGSFLGVIKDSPLGTHITIETFCRENNISEYEFKKLKSLNKTYSIQTSFGSVITSYNVYEKRKDLYEFYRNLKKLVKEKIYDVCDKLKIDKSIKCICIAEINMFLNDLYKNLINDIYLLKKDKKGFEDIRKHIIINLDEDKEKIEKEIDKKYKEIIKRKEVEKMNEIITEIETKNIFKREMKKDEFVKKWKNLILENDDSIQWDEVPNDATIELTGSKRFRHDKEKNEDYEVYNLKTEINFVKDNKSYKYLLKLEKKINEEKFSKVGFDIFEKDMKEIEV